MKYSEAKKAIESLSSEYSAYKDADTEFFIVYHKHLEVAYVRTNKRYLVTVCYENRFKQLPFSNKLYMILSELSSTPLEERVDEKKHNIKIFDGKYGFLNLNTTTNKLNIDTKVGCSYIKTKFTDKEIEQLKQRDDIPLDWDKVHLEDAE